MAKSDSLTVRLDADTKKRLKERCKGLECGQTDYVLGLINSDLGELDAGPASTGETTAARTEAYDIPNPKMGGIDRFDRKGKLIFHFKPTEYNGGIQYYKDTMDSNTNRKWYKNGKGDWIQIVPAY